MERLIAIIGPTAVGKTKISIDLAKMLGTEIISGDSMLVYRGMNIGTAKPTLAERDGVIHHLIDILEPSEEFTVVDFQARASQCIADINRRGKLPILAGGTGLYVKALLEGYLFHPAPGDAEYRFHLEKLAQDHGNQYLHDRLARVDPITASRLHPNDQRRIVRALEVVHLGGDAFSSGTLSENKLIYDAVVIGLTIDRTILYQRINQRVDQMLEQGLVAEVKALLEQGISTGYQSMQGIGYKEIAAYLKGEADLSTASEKVKQATRHFAKRQLTWYRKMPYVVWFDVNEFTNYDKMLATFYNYIAGKFDSR
ncbi:MAG: tRNA (adenosine(37)-N6)-dimethylallyltransferase MiaA [Veillonellales bacterium]